MRSTARVCVKTASAASALLNRPPSKSSAPPSLARPAQTVQVSIYAEDSEGNLVNEGDPLANVTPDFLGRYQAIVSLPSMLRKDVNYLVARETAVATQTSSLAINGTTINGLNASISNPAYTITGIGGTVITPATPVSNIAGTITTPAFPINLGGGGTGTAGPATSTLLGGSGTLNAQVGTLAGGTANVPGTTSTLSDGTGNIAATTGTVTTQLEEVATSDPLLVLIHQPKSFAGPFTRSFATHRSISGTGVHVPSISLTHRLR